MASADGRPAGVRFGPRERGGGGRSGAAVHGVRGKLRGEDESASIRADPLRRGEDLLSRPFGGDAAVRDGAGEARTAWARGFAALGERAGVAGAAGREGGGGEGGGGEREGCGRRVGVGGDGSSLCVLPPVLGVLQDGGAAGLLLPQRAHVPGLHTS
ncbi:unnamed protein product [Ectocarpus sp. 13 AM-2016]